MFREIVSIPEVMSRHNLSLEVLMIKEEEARRYASGRTWRRKGWAREAQRVAHARVSC